MVTLPDYYLLPIPIIVILSYIILMLRSRYILPIFCMVLSPFISCVIYYLWPNKPAISIYYGVILLILSSWFLLSRIPNICDIKNAEDKEKVISLYENVYKSDINKIIEKAISYEKDWQKNTSQISISILSACVAFMFLPEKKDYSFIFTPIFLLFLSALVTLASSALLSLSGSFHLSYPLQEINKLYLGLHRLTYQLNRFWHLIPLSLVLFQITLAGHIAVEILSSPIIPVTNVSPSTPPQLPLNSSTSGTTSTSSIVHRNS